MSMLSKTRTYGEKHFSNVFRSFDERYPIIKAHKSDKHSVTRSNLNSSNTNILIQPAIEIQDFIVY